MKLTNTKAVAAAIAIEDLKDAIALLDEDQRDGRDDVQIVADEASRILAEYNKPRSLLNRHLTWALHVIDHPTNHEPVTVSVARDAVTTVRDLRRLLKRMVADGIHPMYEREAIISIKRK